MDVDDDARTIGARLRRIRNSRGKSLEVIAGLAGISRASLSRIERGERALDSRSETVALANALQISPTDLTRLPVPAPGNGDTDAAVGAVRQALSAVSRNRSGGQVLPIDALRIRVRDLLDALRQCRLAEVGAQLPALTRDLHASIAAGRDVAQLLDLAVVLHTQGSHSWLRVMGAGVDLRSLAVLMARQAAENRDEPTMRGLAVFGDGLVMLAAGDFELARDELDSVTVPTNTSESMQLAGMLALCRSLVASVDKRPADVDAALDYASELAQRTGEGNAYWLGFGPTNVALWRMTDVLEGGDHERVVTIAERLNPRVHPNRSRQAAYWIDYGRALARLRGRQDDAVMALRRGETLSPLHTQRNPFVREVLAELLVRARRDAAGRELRGMAYRAGLPV
ncbi:MAG: helix-turn-helix transcriptional regulator [Pseudonocardiales bacterium]|nr:helix-turn-helix transcriptional regulator [Pseudonocardiales bacterium]MBV9032053.1 helix-turn-helix transcriptional regulator [Pseudonocardiales bacterium]